MKNSILLSLLAVVGTLAVCMAAPQKQAAAPAGDEYQAACVAITAEISLFKSGILKPEQMLECAKRIHHWARKLETFKP